MKQGGRLPTTHLPALRRRVACVILKRWNHHPTGRTDRRGRIDERRPRNNGMLDAATILAIAGTFLLAGAVKGVIGLGLPTVSLALLAVAINLPNAMALLLVPSFVTNVWQAMVGGHGWALLRRIWLFLLVAAITVRLGASALTRVDLSLLSALLGLLLVAYAAANLVGLRFQVQARHEKWVGPLVGLVNGVLTGMTGSFVVPGVMFLQALGLSRDALIQAMGMLFTVSTLALGFALQANGLLRLEHGALSTMAPAAGDGGNGHRATNSRKTLRAIVPENILSLPPGAGRLPRLPLVRRLKTPADSTGESRRRAFLRSGESGPVPRGEGPLGGGEGRFQAMRGG